MRLYSNGVLALLTFAHIAKICVFFCSFSLYSGHNLSKLNVKHQLVFLVCFAGVIIDTADQSNHLERT